MTVSMELFDYCFNLLNPSIHIQNVSKKYKVPFENASAHFIIFDLNFNLLSHLFVTHYLTCALIIIILYDILA